MALTLLYRTFIQAFILAAVSSGAWAQSATLMVGNTISLYGLNFTVGSCSLTISGSAQTNCASLTMQGVNTGQNTISYDLVNTVLGQNVLANTSAAAKKHSTLSLVLNVSNNPLYNGAGDLATNATLIAYGTNNIGACNGQCPNNPVASASAAFSAGVTATPLTDNLALQAAAQTVTSATSAFSSPASANTFNITETLDLFSDKSSITSLNLSSVRLTLHTTPEPASIAILLLGLGGLAVVRRR